MSEKDVRYLALGGAAVVITLIVGIATGWNLITLLVGAVLVGSVLALRIFPHLVTGSESPVARPQAAQAVPGQLRKVGPVSLETATPEFRMMFSATVVWRPNRRAEPARSAAARPSQPQVPPISEPATTTPLGSDEPERTAGLTSDEQAPAESVPPPPPAEAPPGETPPGQDSVDREPVGQLPAQQFQPERTGGGERAWHSDPGGLAAAAAVELAAEIVRGSSAADSGRTAQQLAGELGWERTDPSGNVRWSAEDVQLDPADPDDAARLRTSSRLRKQVHEWEQKREHEKNLREYLGDDVLTTGGSALVWWLARHLDDDEAVPAAVRLINELSTLSMVAQNRGGLGQAGPPSVPPPAPVSSNGDGGINQDLAVATRELLERLFPESGDERMMFARHLASIAERSGRGEYAARMRTLFGIQDLNVGRPESAGEEPQDS